MAYMQTLTRGLRQLQRDRCPGIPMQRLRDCLSVDAGVALAAAMQRLHFDYPSSGDERHEQIAYTIRGFIDYAKLRVSNMRRTADGFHMLVPVGRYEWRQRGGVTCVLISRARVQVKHSP
jgi:hypothetical protein